MVGLAQWVVQGLQVEMCFKLCAAKSIGMSEAYAVPVRRLKRVYGRTVARLILADSGERIDRAAAVRHGDLKRGLWFSGQATIVKPYSPRWGNLSAAKGTPLTIRSELGFSPVH